MKKNYFFLAVLFFGYIGTFAQIPVSYYVNTHGKKMDELKTAFHQIISEPCDVLPYGWGVGCLATQFVKTDNYGDGRVWDMYSDVKLYYPNTYGVNIEHSLPKSWWGVSDETSDIYVGNVKAYQDLHHLSPSNVAANTAKGNYALGEVEGDIPYNDNGDILPFNNYVSKVGPGKSFMGYEENTVFEPDDEYKGDFARMYMYMVTCYENLSNRWRSVGTRSMLQKDTYPVFTVGAQRLLLKWSREDPVSQKEIDRNNAVYAIQRNRNPFIDFPNLAEYIWGDSIMRPFLLDKTAKSGAFDGILPVLPDAPVEGDVLLSTTFMTSLLPFQPVSVTGEQGWKYTSGYGAQMSGYLGHSISNEDWLISPPMDFSDVVSATLKFMHVCNKGSVANMKDNHTLWYSVSYSRSGEIRPEEWIQIPVPKYSSGTSWNDWAAPEIVLPSELNGQGKVFIAFKYLSTDSESATWQIKNLSLNVSRKSLEVGTIPGENADIHIWFDGNGTLRISAPEKVERVSIYGIGGELLYEGRGVAGASGISLPAGLYLVKAVCAGGRVFSEKVICR